MSGELTITSSGDTDDVRIALTGELDGYAAPRLRAAVEREVGDRVTTLTLDIAEVSFVDSTGISILVWAHKRLAERGGVLVLRSPTADVYRVLEITRLTQVFRID
ncbi:MAG: anti-sigma-factor antagonist [Acidimicrobiales bacterium]|nr:anti-sigma-factor antagonist [Acidimicrobiales bacterium]